MDDKPRPTPNAMTDSEYLDRFNQDFWNTLHNHGLTALSRLQRDALCVLNFQAEINNGGMHQYFLNSSGDFAGETPAVFRRIGAEEAARILSEANAFFGQDGPPADREARMAALLAFPKNLENRIDELTGEFYRAEDHGLSLADLFNSYVLSQREAGGS